MGVLSAVVTVLKDCIGCTMATRASPRRGEESLPWVASGAERSGSQATLAAGQERADVSVGVANTAATAATSPLSVSPTPPSVSPTPLSVSPTPPSVSPTPLSVSPTPLSVSPTHPSVSPTHPSTTKTLLPTETLLATASSSVAEEAMDPLTDSESSSPLCGGRGTKREKYDLM
jgi:hypothetical protein